MEVPCFYLKVLLLLHFVVGLINQKKQKKLFQVDKFSVFMCCVTYELLIIFSGSFYCEKDVVLLVEIESFV